ncbi:MAG: PilZ domain-containing protein [Terriglobales bacterium]
MSEKTEPRLDVELPIRVFGMGTDGRPFLQNGRARNISFHGAKLSGLEAQLKPGDVIGVQVGEKKARCKVIWVVDAGASQKIEVGVNLIEGQPCPWEKEMEQARQVPEPVAGIAPADKNKRKFPRCRVPFPLEIQDPDAVGSHMRTKSADISGRGCYVETLLPLPVGKVLNITLWLDAHKVTTPAVIRSCDGGVGMGIEFSGLDEETQERLQRQVEAMAAESGTSENAQGAG